MQANVAEAWGFRLLTLNGKAVAHTADRIGADSKGPSHVPISIPYTLKAGRRRPTCCTWPSTYTGTKGGNKKVAPESSPCKVYTYKR